MSSHQEAFFVYEQEGNALRTVSTNDRGRNQERDEVGASRPFELKS